MNIDEETYARNLRAEVAHTEKQEREDEKYKTTIIEEDLIITDYDYTKKSSLEIEGLRSGPIFKKVRK